MIDMLLIIKNKGGELIMDKTSKKLFLVIIILLILLITGLGVFIKNSYFNDPTNIDTNINSDVENSPINNTNNTANAAWHSILTYSGGISNNYETHDFSSKNGKIKVTFSGLPLENFGDNSLEVYVVKYYNNGGAITWVGDSSISWGSTSAVKTKEGTLKINSEAKKYSIQITPTNMESWTVTVWDYY